MSGEFQVMGTTAAAPFTLRIHRGDGMALLAMNWRDGKPPRDFVGFGIECMPPGASGFTPLYNRLSFEPPTDGKRRFSTLLSPIQKFRWVHFPFDAERDGDYTYRVTPVFMSADGHLEYGVPQVAALELRRETHPGLLNVSYTRGFISSQAFVDRYEKKGPINTLLPGSAKQGLTFQATHPKTAEALSWMGFEARSAILETLDAAIADQDARAMVVAYDLNEPEIVSRLVKLGSRLRVIIDDSAEHGAHDSAEAQAEAQLVASAGAGNVKRQHMGGLQHNKTIVVDSPTTQRVLCGSTNFSWRGLYVQNNNAVVLHGAGAVAQFGAAFERYWEHSAAAGFAKAQPNGWADLGLAGIDAQVAFSPHPASEKFLASVGKEIAQVGSSLFYSLAFLPQTGGQVTAAIIAALESSDIFVYGMSDKELGGVDLQKPDGNVAPVSPAALTKDVPAPFSEEPSGGGGIRMHHKFVVVDFDTDDACVYLGSFNFSPASDTGNGENLVRIRDRRVAVSYMVEALTIFDHYSFRDKQSKGEATAVAVAAVDPSADPQAWRNLAKPPIGDAPAWFDRDYTEAVKVRDRELFS